jgi:hypothetical protein
MVENLQGVGVVAARAHLAVDKLLGFIFIEHLQNDVGHPERTTGLTEVPCAYPRKCPQVPGISPA